MGQSQKYLSNLKNETMLHFDGLLSWFFQKEKTSIYSFIESVQ